MKTLTADFTSLTQEQAELLRTLIVTLAEMLELAVYVTVGPEETKATNPNVTPFSIETFELQDYEEFPGFPIDRDSSNKCLVCGSQMLYRAFQKVEYPSGRRLSYRSFAVCPTCGDSWEF